MGLAGGEMMMLFEVSCAIDRSDRGHLLCVVQADLGFKRMVDGFLKSTVGVKILLYLSCCMANYTCLLSYALFRVKLKATSYSNHIRRYVGMFHASWKNLQSRD